MQDDTAESDDSAPDGAVPVYDPEQAGLKLADSLLIVGKEDWSKGDGSNPFAQLIGCYAKALVRRQDSLFVKHTVCPAFGLEVFGNSMR